MREIHGRADARNTTSDLFEPSYPTRPGFKAHGASEQAARKIAATASILRDRVLVEIGESTRPPTADEVADRIGKSVLSVRPRLSELRRLGKIVPAGERRTNKSGLTASTWKLAPAWSAPHGSGSNG
jgi:hypothetical protein